MNGPLRVFRTDRHWERSGLDTLGKVILCRMDNVLKQLPTATRQAYEIKFLANKCEARLIVISFQVVDLTLRLLHIQRQKTHPQTWHHFPGNPKS